MLKSQVFFAITIFFALYAFYLTLYGLFLSGTKLSQTSETSLLDESDKQWFEPRGKVVMVLFDALRFDYLLNGEFTESNKRHPGLKLRKLNNLMAENPENFVIMRARADSPTLTVNRIPCIATGNIPPKAAVLQALKALPAIEDNFPKQLKMLKRKSYFSGDPLWVQYFPGEFTEAGPANGFNIKDPNVDVEVIAFLKKKLAENDFDLLLTHLLSVDHMGHAYGMNDDRLQEKVADNDQFLFDIIDTIDDDTTLVLLGDHGMDAGGTHGGDTLDETSTAIVAFNKKGFQKYHHQKDVSQVMRSINETILSVKQQDIAPTLSMLMGIPIPFSNLGQIINDIYPAVDYTGGKEEKCPGVAFETQMLRDNYLNSLQIVKYMKTFQLDAHLFAKKDLDHIEKLTKEVETLYNQATEMIQTSQQCEAAFHDLVLKTVIKTQNLSDQVYNLTRATGAFDMPLIHTGLALLCLVILLYVFIMQYLYRKGHNEQHINFDAKTLYQNIKKGIPIIVTLGLAAAVTWYYKERALHSFTTVVMGSALYFCGAFGISLFVVKPTQKQVPQETPTEIKVCKGASESAQKETDDEVSEVNNEVNTEVKEISKAQQTTREDERLVGGAQEDDQPVLQKPLLFLFQAPLYSAIAIVIIVYCILCVHMAEFDSKVRNYVKPGSPFVLFLTAAYRIHRLYPRRTNPVIPLAVIACVIMFMNDLKFTSEKIRVSFGLLLLLDYVCSEIHYMTKKLGTSKLWGAAYLIGFGLLAVFHLATNRENYWIEILVPRLLWAVLVGIIVLRCAFFRVGRKTIVRNLQLCFVLYLALLQFQRAVLAYSVLLIGMKIIGYLFKNVDVLNYLYPVVMSSVCQFGLHILGNNDRNIPMKFDLGFIGLHDFNPVLTPLMVFLSLLTPYSLGMISMSHYNHSLDTTEGDEILKVNLDKKRAPLSKGHSEVIKKRNVLPFTLMFCVIFFGAVMKCYLWRYYFLTEAQDKFLFDAGIYILVMFGGFLMF